MAIISFNVKFSQINSEGNVRLDVKFYWLEDFFVKLNKKKNFKVTLLENLKTGVVSGSYIDEYVSKREGIPYIRVSDIRAFLLDETKSNYKFVKPSVPDKIKVKEGDILIARTGAKIDFLGKASMIDKFSSGWAISQHVTKISVNKKKLSPEYLLAFFNSSLFKIQMALASHGNTRVEFTHSQMDKIRIVMPSKSIEKKVENKIKKAILYNRKSLDLIDSAKEDLRHFLNLKKHKKRKINYFTSNLSSLKEGDLWTVNGSNPLFKEMESFILKEFQTIKLGEISLFEKGDEPGSFEYNFYLQKQKEDIPFIRTSDLVNNEIDKFPDYFLNKDIYKKLNQNLLDGDILFTKDGKVGMTAMINKTNNAIISSGILRIRLDKKLSTKHGLTPEYLFTLLSLKEIGGFQAQKSTVIGATIPHLKENKIKEFIIPIIEKEKILLITKKIKESNKLKELKNEAINETEKIIETFIK